MSNRNGDCGQAVVAFENPRFMGMVIASGLTATPAAANGLRWRLWAIQLQFRGVGARRQVCCRARCSPRDWAFGLSLPATVNPSFNRADRAITSLSEASAAPSSSFRWWGSRA